MTNEFVRQSGKPTIGKSAILSCEFIEQVNTSNDYSFGSCCASQVTVRVKGDKSSAVELGEVLNYYHKEDSKSKKIGVFQVGGTTIENKTSYSFTAFDNIALLNKNVSEWLYALNQNNSFPMNLRSLVLATCTECGVSFATDSFPNENFVVEAFYADNITGRDIISAAAELAGRFVKCDANGNILFTWFSENDVVEIAPSKNGAESGVTRLAYEAGTLSYENFLTAIPDRVQIHSMENDIGVIYPPDTAGVTYEVTGNILLTKASVEAMSDIAETLLSIIRTLRYTPFQVKITKTDDVKVGDIIKVTDINGNTFYSPVFKTSMDSAGMRVESTGSESRDSSSAVSTQKYKNLMGKVLSIQATAEALRIQASALSDKMTTFEQSIDGIITQAIESYTDSDDFKKTISTEVRQEAAGLTITVNNLTQTVNEITNELDGSFTEINKFFHFTETGMWIGESNNDLTLNLDNDLIQFVRNKESNLWITENAVHSGNMVAQRIQIGNIELVGEEDGRMSMRKVGS